MSRQLITNEHITAARQRAEAGEQPWAAALAHLIRRADDALAQPLLSILDAGGGLHFRADGTYLPGKDGVLDEQANREVLHLVRQLSQRTFDLALAWRFTGRTDYADKALALMHEWCLNRNSAMIPTGRVEGPFGSGHGCGGDIFIFVSFPGMFMAGHLLDGYIGWDIHAQAAVRRWVRAMVEPQRPVMFFQGIPMYNNWDDARLDYLASGALLLDDMDLLIEVADRWRQTLPLKMTDEGELPRETMRTRSMNYTLMALTHTLNVAAIAKQWGGIDLFDLTINGKTIRKAVDYAAHYLCNFDDWPHQQITPMDADHPPRLGLFEIAHRQWGDPQHLRAIDAWSGRPVTDQHATLMFADPS